VILSRELHTQSRDVLIDRARSHGVVRPEVLTQAELIDEIIKHATPASRQERVRGWLGRARDLVAQVIDKGLHLPDAAKMFLGPPPDDALPTAPAPLATVTLAEIYAAQGYFDKAIRVLDEVIEAEPDHREARMLKGRFVEAGAKKITAKSEPKSESKSESKSEPKRAPKSDSKSEPKRAAKSEPKSEPKRAPKSEPTSERKRAPKSESPEPAAPIERDELLASASDAHTLDLTWALRPLRLARARAKAEAGTLVLHVLTIDVVDGELRSRTQDVPLAALSGEMTLGGRTPGAEIRACLAWRDDEQLRPLAVAPGVRMPVSG
jgi:hypothetical protein